MDNNIKFALYHIDQLISHLDKELSLLKYHRSRIFDSMTKLKDFVPFNSEAMNAIASEFKKEIIKYPPNIELTADQIRVFGENLHNSFITEVTGFVKGNIFKDNDGLYYPVVTPNGKTYFQIDDIISKKD